MQLKVTDGLADLHQELFEITALLCEDGGVGGYALQRKKFSEAANGGKIRGVK
jgi:hypothetical protein